MWYQPQFKDRRDAGRALAERLSEFADREDVIVLALPRGGVPVGYEVATALGAPMDVFIVRKLGVPGQEELALGALASGGITVFNETVVRAIRISRQALQKVIDVEQAELARRERLYRVNMPSLNVEGRTVLVVDDGLATGATMAAAVKALKKMGPAEVVVAVPVAASQTCEELEQQSGVRCICAATPEPFYGVGMWYEDFSQTTDAEVGEMLEPFQRKAPVGRAHG